MLKRVATMVWLLGLPGAVSASAGAWQASGSGPAISYRGVSASSASLSPSQTVSGQITDVFWRYRLTGPTPAGLQVKLCSGTRCVTIEGASGATRGLADADASGNVHFVFYIEGAGRLFPVFRVLSQQVMVNYQ
ncbi:flagellar protein flhE [[Pantoea] beijingensis]|uniref:Flagellar protein flhE n=1 Tax=[Pantoea] beijingensis TaxID=1324864 RepID=A0A443IIL3_9GAMM|nr:MULTISPECIES: flagellar protein FlhE [Erwiniaceae]RWR03863.1 flagellar protein flhE [[Pantoea] beijingensis]